MHVNHDANMAKCLAVVLSSNSNKAKNQCERALQGCSHYRRRCKIVSPCCGEVFWCRHCHNQVHMEDEPVRSLAAVACQQACLFRFVRCVKC